MAPMVLFWHLLLFGQFKMCLFKFLFLVWSTRSCWPFLCSFQNVPGMFRHKACYWCSPYKHSWLNQKKPSRLWVLSPCLVATPFPNHFKGDFLHLLATPVVHVSLKNLPSETGVTLAFHLCSLSSPERARTRNCTPQIKKLPEIPNLRQYGSAIDMMVHHFRYTVIMDYYHIHIFYRFPLMVHQFIIWLNQTFFINQNPLIRYDL